MRYNFYCKVGTFLIETMKHEQSVIRDMSGHLWGPLRPTFRVGFTLRPPPEQAPPVLSSLLGIRVGGPKTLEHSKFTVNLREKAREARLNIIEHPYEHLPF